MRAAVGVGKKCVRANEQEVTWGGGRLNLGVCLLTCSSSRSAGSASVGTSSVSISDITLTFPLTISSSLRSFPI